MLDVQFDARSLSDLKSILDSAIVESALAIRSACVDTEWHPEIGCHLT